MNRSHFFVVVLMLASVAVTTLADPAAALAPTVNITPPVGARFVAGQRFDIRVEYAPSGGGSLSAVTLTIDNAAQPVAVASLDAFRGINLRAQFLTRKGDHTIRATATDASGTTEATRTIDVVDPFATDDGGGRGLGGNRPVRNVIIFLGDGMGASHRTAARLMRYGSEAGHTRGRLAMDTMPGMGMVMTASSTRSSPTLRPACRTT